MYGGIYFGEVGYGQQYNKILQSVIGGIVLGTLILIPNVGISTNAPELGKGYINGPPIVGL